MDLSDFRADAELQRDGVTIPFGNFTNITIRSSSDERFVNFWNKIKKRYQKEIEQQKLPESIGRELLARAMAQRLVLGWDFLCIPRSMHTADFNGELKVKKATHDSFETDMVEIPYSKENCFTLLNHPNYSSFRGWIMTQANDLANFQSEEFEDDLGNLRNGVNGKSSGESTKKT